MARVLALIPDLLFGSRVQGALLAAGHEVELLADPTQAAERLPGAAVLVVDLTAPEIDPPALMQVLGGLETSAELRTLGFFAHVDPATRERALAAGFDLVVPRSRMAREGAALVASLSPGS